MSSIARAIAYVALAAALLVAAITFNVGKYPTEDMSSPQPSGAARDLGAELARCKKINPETVDAACLVVWEANRYRFFRAGKSRRDGGTDAVPATPDPKDDILPERGARSDIAARSPGAPADNTGRRK
jgi:conjugative transfer region protein TrbK